MRPSAILERLSPAVAVSLVVSACATQGTSDNTAAAPTAQPELAYTPRSGGVATEARYKRDQSAMPKDAAATKKIEEAVNDLYLVGKMREAEAQLKGVYQACDAQCSPGVKAKAWMYIGIVRGSGNGNLKSAREAFQFALELDPTARLDVALATPETKAVFDEEKDKAKPAASPPPPPPPAAAPGAAPAPAPTQPGQPGVPIAPPPPPATK